MSKVTKIKMLTQPNNFIWNWNISKTTTHAIFTKGVEIYNKITWKHFNVPEIIKASEKNIKLLFI